MDYYHLLFSVPHSLVPLVWQNKKVLFKLLFEANAEALLEVAADPKHIGAEIGFLSVFWGLIDRSNAEKIGQWKSARDRCRLSHHETTVKLGVEGAWFQQAPRRGFTKATVQSLRQEPCSEQIQPLPGSRPPLLRFGRFTTRATDN